MISPLALSLGASTLWCVILFVSDRTRLQPWPPVEGGWFTALWAWGLTSLIYVGQFQAATADWNALGWNAWVRWSLGGVILTVPSLWLQGKAMADLGLKGTSGWNVGLVTNGTYARRRHPQYTGQIISLIGLGVLAGSIPALIAGAAGSGALVYAAMVEDRTLARRHAETFAAYKAQTSLL